MGLFLRIIVAVTGLALAAGPVDARDADEGIAKMKGIIENGVTDHQGNKKPRYMVKRGFWDYVRLLQKDESDQRFQTDLEQGKNWLDVGAGSMVAQFDWITDGKAGEMVARSPTLYTHKQFLDGARAYCVVGVSVEDAMLPQFKELMPALNALGSQYLTGRYIEEYTDKDIGTFDVITDVYGAVAYAPHIDKVFEKAGELLNMGGHFYTFVEKGDPNRGSRRHGKSNVEFSKWMGFGSETGFVEWLGSFQCLKVEVSTPEPAKEKGLISRYVLRTEKTCADVKVPPLELVDFKEGFPPYRSYRR